MLVAPGDDDRRHGRRRRRRRRARVRRAGRADRAGAQRAATRTPPGVSATLLGGGSASTVTQGSSAYPTIAADDGRGREQHRVRRRTSPTPPPAAPTCAATLAIATGAETQTVPLVLPTGAPGPLQSNVDARRSRWRSPTTTPAGVSSSVFVPDRGRIKDVNVTIAGITHTLGGRPRDRHHGPRRDDRPAGRPPRRARQRRRQLQPARCSTTRRGQNISQGTAPYTGNFKPQDDQLSRFDGKSRRGTWTLRVRDLFEGDVGTLRGWGVATQKALCNVDTTPPDTTIASAPRQPDQLDLGAVRLRRRTTAGRRSSAGSTEPPTRRAPRT